MAVCFIRFTLSYAFGVVWFPEKFSQSQTASHLYFISSVPQTVPEHPPISSHAYMATTACSRRSRQS